VPSELGCLLAPAQSESGPTLLATVGRPIPKDLRQARLANQPTPSPVRSPSSSVPGGGEQASSDALRPAIAGEEHPTRQVLLPLLSSYFCAKGRTPQTLV
jgi:hypothetical protein